MMPGRLALLIREAAGVPWSRGTPLTTLTYTGGTPGKNGWLLSPVTITMTAKDYSSRGIDYTEYSKDSVNWTKYAGPA